MVKQIQDTWNRIFSEHGEELGIVAKCDYAQFGKTKKTPVTNVQGVVQILFWLPGETAKQFRSKSAETMIRYLGGDLTLIDEIKAIDRLHVETPDNVVQVFRQEVVNQSLLNYNQINNSKQLLSYFGSKTNVMYLLIFYYDGKWYLKFGMVNVRPFFEIQ